MQDDLLGLNNIHQLFAMKCSTNQGCANTGLVFITAVQFRVRSWRLSAYERLQQKTDQLRKGREVKGGKAGEERERGLYSLMWPGLSAVLKITAFTLQLKNSCSDHLFRRKSSSSIVFPRPLQPRRHMADTPRVSRFLPLSWMCEILCFWFTSLSASLPKKAAVSSSCHGVPVEPDL